MDKFTLSKELIRTAMDKSSMSFVLECLANCEANRYIGTNDEKYNKRAKIMQMLANELREEESQNATN